MKTKVTTFLLMALLSLLVNVSAETGDPATETKKYVDVVRVWLKTRHAKEPLRCKVILGIPSRVGQRGFTEKGDRIKLTGYICGNNTAFWINKKTLAVESYIEYLGNNEGKILVVGKDQI
jgi:hypothetical protein